MRLADRLARLHAAFDAGRAMADVTRLAGYDRYQASSGIQQAAAYVAERASEAGLADVEVVSFPPGRQEAWWTFDAPPAWTPRHASLDLLDERGSRDRIAEYPAQPYLLAVNSAPAERDWVPLARWEDGGPRGGPPDGRCAPGSLLLGTADVPLSNLLSAARRHQLAGIAIAGASRRRVELPPGDGLFAFSLTVAEMDRLLTHYRARGQVAVTVRTAAAGNVPVVTARVPGREPDELMCVAHLCHPAPSANDNASGVAVTLEVARLLAGEPGKRGVRLVWGPEFTGTAAYLSAFVGEGRAPRPLVAVNVDMAGENQQLCGGPLILERSPDHIPYCLNAVAEAAAALIPQRAASYSGAVPCDTWAWRVTPFAGASDHGLLADRSVGCPAIQLGHWPDRFNHTSADGLDKVDAEEMRRVAAIAAATVSTLQHAKPDDADWFSCLVARWGAARLLEQLPHPDDPWYGRAGWIEPRAGMHATARLDHCQDVVAGAVRSLSELGMPEPALAKRLDWLADLARHLRSELPAPSPSPSRLPAPAAVGGTPLRRRWRGPFNIRAFARSCAPDDAAWLAAELEADRGACYTAVLALAQAVDGIADRETAGRTAAISSGIPIRAGFADRFLAASIRAGWLSEGDAEQGRAGHDDAVD